MFQEVVDYAYDNGMYIILNTHHDNSWIKLDAASEKDVTKKFKTLWKQIAERFKDYDEKLIFEGLNEPRTEGSAKEWSGGTKAEWEVINRLHKAFVSHSVVVSVVNHFLNAVKPFFADISV